jgi:uncharacterized protein (TIGR00730 family)
MSKNDSIESFLEKEECVRRIIQSPTYRRADQDLDFLARDELRSSRLQLEFLKPELKLEEAGIGSTIVVFGGSRIVEADVARHDLEVARDALQQNPQDKELQRRLSVAERVLAKSHYYEIAREFGGLVGQANHGDEDSRLVIVTGGGPGLMEAANRGAFESGAMSIGLNITLPHEQLPNPYITPELCFQFRYFALRKMHFLLRAKALVVFPGGYGTLDEFFDILTLIQTEKVEPVPLIMVGEEYWRRVFDIQFLADEGTIDQKDVDLFMYAETAKEIWDLIIDWYEKTGKTLFPPTRASDI